jgi:tetratricopeptide (TPR) repeat protein
VRGVIQVDPDYALAYANRGVNYSEKGEHDKAIGDLDEAIKLDPRLTFAYHSRGQDYYYKRQYENAISDFIEAIN